MATQPEIVSASLAKHVPGQRVVILGRDENGDPHELLFDSATGGLVLASGVTIAGGDIEIGAVELKDGASDTRARIVALTSVVSGDNGLGVTDPIAVAKLELVRALLAGTLSVDGLLQGRYEASPTSLSDGDPGDFLLDAFRDLRVALFDPATGETFGTTTHPVAANIRTLTASDILTAYLTIAGTAITGGSGVITTGTQRVVLATDQPSLTSPLAPIVSTYTNWGAATKANIKGTPGTLMAVVALNRNATVRYLQLHNKATAPVAGEAPLLSFPLPAGTTNNPGTVVLGETDLRRAFSLGLGWAISTTESTFTDPVTTTDYSITVGYL